MPEIRASQVGLETAHYLLPCGCKIYVYFPGGTIHLQGNTVRQCDELRRLWSAYWGACGNGHNWTSMNRYLACLRHIGAWQGRIAWCETERDRYPKPAESNDYPAES